MGVGGRTPAVAVCRCGREGAAGVGGPRRRAGRGPVVAGAPGAGGAPGRTPGNSGGRADTGRVVGSPARCPVTRSPRAWRSGRRPAVGARRTGTGGRGPRGGEKAGVRAPDARPGAPLPPRPLSGAAPSSPRRSAHLPAQVPSSRSHLTSPRRSLLPAPPPLRPPRRRPARRRRPAVSDQPQPQPQPQPPSQPGPPEPGPPPGPQRLRASDRVRWAIATTAASMKRPSGRAWAPGVVVAALRMVSAWSSSAGVGR